MLRASIKEAASAATKGAAAAAAAASGSPSSAAATTPGSSGSGGGGSSLLWSLLRNCLRQQGEALFDVQACRAAAKDAQQLMLQVAPLAIPRVPAWLQYACSGLHSVQSRVLSYTEGREVCRTVSDKMHEKRWGA